MQHERRRDPYHWSWEIPLLAGLLAIILLLAGIQVGRGVANMFAGAGWTWPQSTSVGGFSSPLGGAFWSSLFGVITGHADAGLPGVSGVAGPGLLWFSIALTELALFAVLAWTYAQIWMNWGPTRMRGMASRSEAEKTLGVTRLRKSAPVVRPDLYGKHAHRPQPEPQGPAAPHDSDGPQLGRGLSPWLLERHTAKENR